MPAILILNYEYPPIGGGAGAISAAHAEHLANLGYKVVVVTASPNGILFQESPIKNLSIVRLASIRKKPFQSGFREKIDWMFKALRYCKRFKPSDFDFCMAHFSIPGGWVAAQLPFRYGVISHGHDIPWFYPQQMFVYHVLTYFSIKRIINKAEVLWVQSEAMRKNATTFTTKTPVVVIPNGCDAPPDAHPIPFRGGTLRLLFAGRLVKQKRVDILIEAVKILNRQNADVHLTIAGDGPLAADLKKRIRPTENNIDFIGLVPRENMSALYRNHHVIIAPSEAEGMSISVLEALFHGLYTITTAVSGNTDLLKNSALGSLSEPSPEAFAEAIMQYMQHPPSSEKREEVYEKLVNIHRWESIVKTYVKSMSL